MFLWIAFKNEQPLEPDIVFVGPIYSYLFPEGQATKAAMSVF